MVFEF